MPSYLAHITGTEHIGANLLLKGQVPLHDVRLRVMRIVSVNLTGDEIVNRRDDNRGRTFRYPAGPRGTRNGSGNGVANHGCGNKRHVIQVHRRRCVVLGEAAHSESAAHDETLLGSRGKAKAWLEVGPVGFDAGGCADNVRIATGGRAQLGPPGIEV